KFSLCPMGWVFVISEPPPTDGASASSQLYSVGASLGWEATKSGNTAIEPTFALAFNALHSTNDFPGFGTFSGTAKFGTLHLGVGFVFNSRMALVPSIIVPFGSDVPETTFSVVFATKIGK